MNKLSTTAVSDFVDFGIVSSILSPQGETALSSCGAASLRSDRTTGPRAMSMNEAAATVPQLLEALASHVACPIDQLYSIKTPQAFTLDTSFLGNRVTGTDNHGQVFVLPEIFLSQACALSMQKPSLVSALSADYIYAGHFYCWRSNQNTPNLTYDLWLSPYQEELIAVDWLQGGDQSENGPSDEIRHCWTDVIVVCGNQVFLGGFWSDTDDGFAMQAASHGAINYRARRQWTSEDLEEAQERAAAIGTIAPWEDQVCVNAEGRRYRFVHAPLSRLYKCLLG